MLGIKRTDVALEKPAASSLSGKNIIVVGGTAGIGAALAAAAAANAANVTVVGRTQRDASLRFVKADLQLMSTSQKVARELPAETCDVLIFTNGIVPGDKREQTAEGVEMDMAVSVLNRHVMLKEMVPRLKPAARVLIWGFPGSGGGDYLKKTSLSDFNSTVGAWVATDWTRAAATGGPGSDRTCAQGQPTATCADVCANLNLRCNPCATARALACQTPLFYALQQAGKSDPDILTAAGKPGQVLNGVPPPPRNGFVGTGCTSVSGAVAGWSDVNIANSQAVCGDGASEPPIQTASWPFTQNFFSPADAGYKTPESACTLPIRGKQPGPNPGDFPLVEYGTVCYCGR